MLSSFSTKHAENLFSPQLISSVCYRSHIRCHCCNFGTCCMELRRFLRKTSAFVFL